MENKTVRHILVGKVRQETTPAQFDEMIAAFRGLKEEIPGILSFEYGANNSAEGLTQGMTHVIQLTFVDAVARDAYLVHPTHVRFAHWLGGLGMLESLLVIDYSPQE